MNWFVVVRAETGKAVSIGTVVADPLPDGLEAIALSEADGELLRTGAGRWDDATRSVVPLPVPTPESVTARQARLWLIRHGITLAQVDAVIAAIPDAMTRQTVQIDWEYSTEVRRASPFVEQLGQALGLDDAALDVAFREAASI